MQCDEKWWSHTPLYTNANDNPTRLPLDQHFRVVAEEQIKNYRSALEEFSKHTLRTRPDLSGLFLPITMIMRTRDVQGIGKCRPAGRNIRSMRTVN
jgi:hypothetical protein